MITAEIITLRGDFTDVVSGRRITEIVADRSSIQTFPQKDETLQICAGGFMYRVNTVNDGIKSQLEACGAYRSFG